MKKFILLYNGPATDPSDMPEEARKAIMAKWGEWMVKAGSSLVDMGQPMVNGASVVDDGTNGVPTQLNGYSIIQADDMEKAKALVAGHPFLSEGAGKFSVEIYELLPAPKM
ncbi:hypothetical protein HYT01_03450 [Candidatus Giovannonibacteria bacterium]|nr:hypothetical protein [Candidatus Giovannonibacteria bacterium]